MVINMELNQDVNNFGIHCNNVNETRKKVFVSGCFDLLHVGHIQFFKTASQYGDLYVSIGNDENLKYLKSKTPVYSQEERLFMIKSLSCVKDAVIAKGMGIVDFLDELESINPDYFVVNEDGHTEQKQKIVEDLKIQYIVLKREPPESLPARSSTNLRRFIQESHQENFQPTQPIKIPYRIDLCGGWLDQPFVSRLCSGSVITFPVYGAPYEFHDQPLNLNNTIDFSGRSGMASSTRKSAVKLWGNSIGYGEPQKLAFNLFCYNNPPGTNQISGAQDSIGIVIPGVVKSFYNGEYWPLSIDAISDEAKIDFLEKHLCLIPLQPRVHGYNPLSNTNVTVDGAQKLAQASRDTWRAINNLDLEALGKAVTAGFRAQISMFPYMSNEYIDEFIADVIARNHENILGYKLTGAGGGGYMICVVRQPLPNSIVVKIAQDIKRN